MPTLEEIRRRFFVGNNEYDLKEKKYVINLKYKHVLYDELEIGKFYKFSAFARIICSDINFEKSIFIRLVNEKVLCDRIVTNNIFDKFEATFLCKNNALFFEWSCPNGIDTFIELDELFLAETFSGDK